MRQNSHILWCAETTLTTWDFSGEAGILRKICLLNSPQKICRYSWYSGIDDFPEIFLHFPEDLWSFLFPMYFKYFYYIELCCCFAILSIYALKVRTSTRERGCATT